MNNNLIDENGKLQEVYLPAIYFDSSVVIDYWISEYMEMPEDKFSQPNDNLLRDLFLKDKRIKDTFEIRDRILSGQSKVTPIITSLSLIELMEWHVEAVFKELASESLGTMFIQKKSKKEVGDYLKKLLMSAEENLKEEHWRNYTEDWKIESLKELMSELWLNRSFVNHHGLWGLLQADIKNFSFSIDKAWQEPSAYAFLQLGAADTLHILFAEHLGCKYFASFDSDFKRAKNIINEKNEITVLTNPQEILKVI